MHAFMSMTSTLLDAAEDENVLALMAEPDTRFIFNCVREYVLNDDASTAPFELTWIRSMDFTGSTLHRRPHGDDRVELATVPGPAHALWTRFRAIIAAADADQRIWWGAGRWNDDEINAFYPDSRGANTFEIADRLRADGHTVHGR